MKRLFPWFGWALHALLVILVWQNRGLTHTEVGTLADEQVVRHFHARETNALDTYRWSTLDAQLRLPAYQGLQVLELRGSPAPDGTQVTIQVNPRDQVALDAYTGTLGMRRYLLVVPPQAAAAGWQEVAINGVQSSQPLETRQLGMVLTDLGLHAVDRSAPLPPLVPWAILAAIPVLLYALFRLLGLSRGLAFGLSLGLGSLATSIWGFYPFWIQPFLPIGLGVLAVYAGLVWWLRRKIATASSIHPVLAWTLVLVVFGGVIPLYQYQYYGFFDLASTLHWHNWPIIAALLALGAAWIPARWRAWLIGGVAIVIVAYGIASYRNVFVDDFADDFKVLFRGPRSFLRGDDLYDLESIRLNALSNLYKYPPFFVLVIGGLTELPFGPAIQIWRAINLVAFCVGLGMLWRWSKLPLRSWSTVALIYCGLAFQQAADVLGYGQVDMLVVVAAAGALLALGRQRWGLWGALLAIPAAIKFYPAYLALHAAVHRRWRGLLGFGGAFLGLMLLSIAVLGWDIHATYLREVLPISGAGTAWVENQTFNGFLNRLITLPIRLAPETSAIVPWFTYACAIALTLLTAWRARSMDAESGFGLWMVSMLIIVPAAWIHYEVIVIIPIYELLVRLERQSERWSWRTVTLSALAWSLLCYGNQWTFFNRTYHGPVWTLLLSYKLYALLLLWAAIAFDPNARRAPLPARDASADAPAPANQLQPALP